jgi:hypothetical protein
MARELGVDQSDGAFETALKKVAPPKAKAKRPDITFFLR